MSKKYPTCPQCGGEDVLLDGMLKYDIAGGEWIHDSDDDDVFCRDCGESLDYDDLKWLPVEEPEGQIPGFPKPEVPGIRK